MKASEIVAWDELAWDWQSVRQLPHGGLQTARTDVVHLDSWLDPRPWPAQAGPAKSSRSGRSVGREGTKEKWVMTAGRALEGPMPSATRQTRVCEERPRDRALCSTLLQGSKH